MLETTKQCTQCKTIKNISGFSKDSRKKDGLRSNCKSCGNYTSRQYMKTKDGLVSKIYGNQKLSSKRRGYNPPTYTKKDLRHWLYSQKKFHILYDNWKRLDYQMDYIPSVDRKDDYIGYTMDNIQLMTWKENNEKYYSDVKNGINNKINKTVIQFEKDGTFVAEFHSTCEAERATGINQANISSCCRGKLNTTGGFKWVFSKEGVNCD